MHEKTAIPALVFGLLSFVSLYASPRESAPEAIPFGRIGIEAEKQYSGDGISIRPEGDGARLRVDFQRLEAAATREGLWLESTEGPEKTGRFRLLATGLGRERAEAGRRLEGEGRVVVSDGAVAFARPGLVEEYRVGMDGVRQDFVVTERPAGDGELMVGVEVDGAIADNAVGGVRLTLEDGGREIAYSRLHVVDAAGRELAAKMEVSEGDRIRILVDDAGAVYPVRIDPTFSDADWVGFGGLPGPDDEVHAMAVDGSGNLYIGGDFSTVGETIASRVAMWDGSEWAALGTGVNSSVHALAVSGGDLYAGGLFTEAGGSTAFYVAKWSGSAWSALGTGGPNGAVLALAVSGGDLFVGGSFNATGGNPSGNRVAKWDGTGWSALGTGVNNGQVLALAADGSGNVYAGGSFTMAGGDSANRVAKWDDNTDSWSNLDDGVNDIVYALAVDGSGHLYAGGNFTMAGGISVNRIAKWDDDAGEWSALGTGMNVRVSSLAVDGSDLYAGGIFNSADGQPANRVAKWNGSAWSALGSGVGHHEVACLAVIGDDLFAGGVFTVEGGAPSRNLARFDGTDWSRMAEGGGVNDVVYALAEYDGDLYIGGVFTRVGAAAINAIAKWDGSAWSALGDGLPEGGSYVYALAASDEGLYVGGDIWEAGGELVGSIALWDGEEWSSLDGGSNGAISAFAVGDGVLYAGGSFTEVGGISASNIAMWDGEEWHPLGVGVDDEVEALAYDDGDLYAGGRFTEAGGQAASHIAMWADGAWSPLGDGTNDRVNALAVAGSNLFVGGEFDEAGSVEANHVAMWNGSDWSALGEGVSSQVQALIVIDGELYVGGTFDEAGEEEASRIAKWDGATWSPLGSGVNEDINAFALSGGDLYAGGWFTVAGGKASAHLAKAVISEILVTGNGAEIDDGDDTPDTDDHTEFGDVSTLGGSTARTFTIESTGGGNLVLTGDPAAVVLDGSPAFNVTQQPASPVAADGETTFSVTFAPTTPGEHAATVSIASNDTDHSPFTFTIAGFGTVPQIGIVGNGIGIVKGDDVPSPSDHTDFGTTTALGGSVARTFTVGNAGTEALVLSDAPTSVVISGSSAFTVTQQAVSPVAPNGDTTFIVTFAPTTSGAHTATVIVASNDPDDDPFTFAIGGFATLPEIDLSGNSVSIPDGSDTASPGNGTAFGSVSILGSSLARTFVIANDGDENLLLDDSPDAVAVSGSPAFSVTQQAASPVATDGESIFVVTFAPTTSGPHAATVSIASNDPDEDPYTFALSGVGVQPTLAIAGNGSPILHGSGGPTEGDHRHFGSTSFLAGSVVRTFTLSNSGSATLNFTGGPNPVSISGSSAFKVVAQPAASIEPGGGLEVQILFDPGAPGPHSATVTIASDDPETGVYTFQIKGIGAQPLIVVRLGARTLSSNRGVVNFKQVRVRRRSKPRLFTIANVGDADLSALKVAATGRNRRNFLVSRPSRATLPSGAKTTFNARFRPTAKGLRKANLEVRSNAANTRVFRIRTMGQGR